MQKKERGKPRDRTREKRTEREKDRKTDRRKTQEAVTKSKSWKPRKVLCYRFFFIGFYYLVKQNIAPSVQSFCTKSSKFYLNILYTLYTKTGYERLFTHNAQYTHADMSSMHSPGRGFNQPLSTPTGRGGTISSQLNSQKRAQSG